MRRWVLSCAATVLALGVGSPRAQGPVQQPPNAIMSSNPYAFEVEAHTRRLVWDAGSGLRSAKQYDVIEQIAERYRATKSRTPSGNWLNHFFHEGVRSRPAAKNGKTTPEEWSAWLSELRHWTTLAPKSPIAHITLASALHSKGWWHRGTGFAHTVTPEGWTKLKEYSSKARAVLDEAKQFAAVDPEWFVTRIIVALDLDEPDVKIQSLLSEGARLEPTYFYLHATFANRLLPRWGGNYRSLDAWMRSAANSVGASEGQALYVRLYWTVWGQFPEVFDQVILADVAAWERMKAGMRIIVDRYPSLWNTTQFLEFACFAGDQPFFQSMWTEFNRQKSGPILLSFRDAPVTFADYCRNPIARHRERLRYMGDGTESGAAAQKEL